MKGPIRPFFIDTAHQFLTIINHAPDFFGGVWKKFKSFSRLSADRSNFAAQFSSNSSHSWQNNDFKHWKRSIVGNLLK